MKVRLTRSHTSRPQDYENILLSATVEVDLEEDEDFKDLNDKEVGSLLGEVLDGLLEKEVDRVLRLPGEHVQDTHLWEFYGRD